MESVRRCSSTTGTWFDIAKSGLYGLLRFHEITGDQRALEIALKWFKDRFEIGDRGTVGARSGHWAVEVLLFI